jgi:hypothetical protein
METERDVERLLSLVADDANLSILPSLRGALALIERSPVFEGDVDLAAALLVLHEAARDLSELCERANEAVELYAEERRGGVLALIGGRAARIEDGASL